MKKIFSLFLFCMMNWVVPATAQSNIYTPTEEDMKNKMERFIHFHLDIEIFPDGNAVFTENITLYAAGIDIRRGIIRNIPEYRKEASGRKKNIRVKVLNVMIDGEESIFRTESRLTSGNPEQLIYTNESDYLLQKGIHRFTIVYESRGHVGFFDDYDEMYWNVMGSDCAFSIENISATIHPPGGTEAINWSCYTGSEGSVEKACDCNGDKSAPFFKTSRALLPGEGFTVSASFPRDIITRPTESELFWEQYRSNLVGFILILVAGLSMFIIWIMFGRDAKKQLIVPQFRPPNNWSPAEVRYLYKRKIEDKAFTATLLHMAVKGAIGIECRQKGGGKKGKSYYLVPKNKEKLTKGSGEGKIFDSLFVSKLSGNKENEKLNEREVSSASSSYLSSAMYYLSNLTTSVSKDEDYYKKNKKYIWIGLVMCVVFWLIYCFVSYDDSYDSSFMFFVPFFLIIFYQIFRKVMGARTELGARTVAELAGLRMYLGTAERHWLNRMMPPEQTPQHFEEMLPYAVALDVENQWCERFHDVLERYNYAPVWYSDTDFSSNALTGMFASKVYTTLSSSIKHSGASSRSIFSDSGSSSSSGSSSWSSGSGGGGYSGGGGGGGGARGY